MLIVRVALDVPVHDLFDYLAPAGFTSDDVGRRVQVPFGTRQRVGVIAEVANQTGIPERRLKPVTHILDDAPPLPRDWFALLRFCSDYYRHPLGEVVINALPTALRRAQPLATKTRSVFELTVAGAATGDATLPKRAVVKRKLLTRLRQSALADDEARRISPRAIKALHELIAAGWVEQKPVPTPIPAPQPDAELPGLTSEQRSAVDQITTAEGFKVWLLHGVTGSGKTEVYLRAIARVLAAHRQALVLVPEIALTPQLEALFRARFPQANLVTLHSGLAVGERARHWLAAQAGDARIVLGTRLAVFTPLARLGLIVVDEEQDASFKQQEGLRYSARDVAIFRAKQHNVPIVLGSATPALESWHNALRGRYALARLTHRAIEGAELPKIRCVDTRQRPLTQGLSAELIAALAVRLERGEQSLVFINRRGYAPVLMCEACGWKSACRRCASYLVLHLRALLRCHHCGHQENAPAACPDCAAQGLIPVGQGTQRIEAALTSLFPEARILRVDRDSACRKHAWRDMLTTIQNNQADILVGTQMLAKGHDFANLTLVGVLNADSSLYSADWRASERLFAQLIQVAGRAGRGAISGEVLIQTSFPGHPLYRAAITHDFDAVAATLLAERKRAGFPPFVHQVLLRAEASQLEVALVFAAAAAREAHALELESIKIFEPVAAPMMRIAGMERAQLLIQSPSRSRLQTFLAAWHGKLLQNPNKKVRWSLDVDPLGF